MGHKSMKVIILAGGFGTRLAEFTETLPKPIVKIGNKPILWHIMKNYSFYGHKDFYIALGYKGSVIKEFFLHYRTLNSDFTVGFDTRNNKQDSEYTIWGRNELNDDYQISGLYLQGTLELGSKLDLTFAGRYDSYGFLDDTSFAPRVALVYKASPKHTFRASYNQAAFIPSALEMFIDFPVNTPAPGAFDIWLSGQASEQTFSNGMIDFTIPGWPSLPAASTNQLPLSYFYGSLAGLGFLPDTLAGAAAGILQQSPNSAPLLPIFNNFFKYYCF